LQAIVLFNPSPVLLGAHEVQLYKTADLSDTQPIVLAEEDPVVVSVNFRVPL
jgi:hypothetical protein